MILGDFPPSSKIVGIKFLAAFSAIIFPMFDEPVKKIKSKLSSLKILNSFISFDEQYIMDSSKLSLIILFIKVHEFSETSDLI
ncbi:hypothetical protein [Mycoplasmopsis cynos]|uniref:hypothetical protein n=2 Tax=Mycoplasmopsis cynos TaxID=171284 RepID=UPI0024CCAE2C|nr:hypothetical protein [Mycoplasmopsis cynos]WAM08299.1 hypothetical protein ONA21_03420 [Mycoplasmopsis cynos]